MRLKTIRGVNFKNKLVLVRVDFNCPIKNGRVIDDSRITAVLPTIRYLQKQKAKVILISHLGDPIFKNSKSKTLNPKQILNSKSQIIKKQYSLRPIYNNLKFKIQNLKFIDDCSGEKVKEMVKKMNAGEALLLENLRFYPGEKKNDRNFAKELASLADVYINDAFAVSHRAHASVSVITKFLPSYAGFLLEKEVKALLEVLKKPRHPLVVLIGGAKISTKIKVIKNLARRADKILLAGALANTFFVSQDYPIGKSLYEKEMVGVGQKLMKKFGKKIVLPIDVIVKLKIKDKKLKTQIKNVKIEELNKFKNQSTKQKVLCSAEHINMCSGFQILDIGPETVKLFSKYLKTAKMIVWNGPMGYFEEKPFDLGTQKIAQAIFANKKAPRRGSGQAPRRGSGQAPRLRSGQAKIVIGGGDTLAALRQDCGLTRTIRGQTQTKNRGLTQTARGLTRKCQRVSALGQRKSASVFVSTGGGAMLEFLEGKPFPGIRPLLKRG